MDLSNIVGINGLPAAVYYGALILITVFFAGFYLKSKLAKLCAETNTELETRMKILEDKLKQHEADTIKVSTYEKDMANVKDLFIDIKRDIREGFIAVNTRIDTILQKAAVG